MSAGDPKTSDLRPGAAVAASSAAGASACASIQVGASWQEATNAVLDTLDLVEPDLAVVFVDSHFTAHYGDILERIGDATDAKYVIGCSGQAVIGPGLEAEGQAAISVMVFQLPGVTLTPLALLPGANPDEVFDAIEAAQATAWLVFADPVGTHTEQLIAAIQARAPQTPVLGGIASAVGDGSATAVFLGERAYPHGAVLLGISGDIEVHTLVAQGAEPIGEAWTVTDCESNVVKTIGSRPAVEVLQESLNALDQETRERAQRNLPVGLAIDEYRDEFGRGDYLIRNIMGFDEQTGAIAINARPRIGQTIQFQFRDATAADEDLVTQLAAYKTSIEPDQVVLGALLFACNGRGRSLFRSPNHDAQALTDALGPVPTAGLFCNGEIGPVGGEAFLHGFTASIAFLTAQSK